VTKITFKNFLSLEHYPKILVKKNILEVIKRKLNIFFESESESDFLEKASKIVRELIYTHLLDQNTFFLQF